MWSGCIPCGNSTRFGSGNSRARPLNASSAASSLIGSPSCFFEKLLRFGPVVRRRVERDGRQQLLVRLGPRRVGAGQQRGEATRHLLVEVGEVQAAVPVAVAPQVVAAG